MSVISLGDDDPSGGDPLAAGDLPPGSAGEGEGQATDRRHDARAPIELRVEYKRLNTFFHDYTKNISKGGTFIKTDRPLEIGTLFLFRLILPPPEEPLTLRGDVRWVVRVGEPPPPESQGSTEPGMGIRFVYDAPDEKLALTRRVERLMTGSLGPLIYGRLLVDPPR